MSEPINILEQEFERLVLNDKPSRRLKRDILNLDADIADLNIRTAQEMARLKSSKESLRAQIRERHKWVKAKAANIVRERLGIAIIPGYSSPVDKLLEQRAYKRKYNASTKSSEQNSPPNGSPQQTQEVRSDLRQP